jgi:hypothetical protein
VEDENERVVEGEGEESKLRRSTDGFTEEAPDTFAKDGIALVPAETEPDLFGGASFFI